MVTADQRSPSPTENFVLFPFTHPALVRRREASDLCLPLEISTTNMVINDMSITSITHGKVSTADDSRLYGSSESQLSCGTNSKENRIEADYDRSGGLHEKAKNGEFLCDENETDEFHDFAREHLNMFGDNDRTSQNVISRESMLVQVGQPDIDEAEQSFDEVEEEETGDTADLSSDSVFGPAVSVELDLAADETPPLVTRDEIAPVSNGYILMLETKLGMNRSQFQNQQRAIMLFNARHLPYKTLDGSDSTNKEIRNELFKLSDMRGAYPQFFVVRSSLDDEHTTTTFLGDWETIEGINDSSSLPAELLEANPTLMTWNRIPGLSFKLA